MVWALYGRMSHTGEIEDARGPEVSEVEALRVRQ